MLPAALAWCWSPASRSRSPTSTACCSRLPTSNRAAAPSAIATPARHISPPCSRWRRRAWWLTQGGDYRIIEINEAFRQLAGYTNAEAVGRVADDLQLWGDAGQRLSLEAEIEAHGSVRNHDVRVVHKGGAVVDCLLSATLISRRGDACVLWLYQDITARRHGELELVEAIDAVMKDASWFGRSIMDKLATLRRPPIEGPAVPPPADLSRREREVLALICEGLDDAAISARLSLSPNTVRNHVARLYAKIGVNRRSAAIIWARERGLH